MKAVHTLLPLPLGFFLSSSIVNALPSPHKILSPRQAEIWSWGETPDPHTEKPTEDGVFPPSNYLGYTLDLTSVNLFDIGAVSWIRPLQVQVANIPLN